MIGSIFYGTRPQKDADCAHSLDQTERREHFTCEALFSMRSTYYCLHANDESASCKCLILLCCRTVTEIVSSLYYSVTQSRVHSVIRLGAMAFVVSTLKELFVLKKAGIVLCIYEGIVRREGINVGPTIFQLNISASGQIVLYFMTGMYYI